MAHTLPPDAEKLIDRALRRAVKADGPVKLYSGKYDQDGLFARRTGLCKKAAHFGFGSKPPLWSEEPRSAMNRTLMVRLLPGGLERLVKNTPSRSRPKLVRTASVLYQQTLLERWADLAAAHGWKSDFEMIADCCSDLMSKFKKLVPNREAEKKESAAVTESQSEPGKLGGEDADFKRRMAHELVIAWKYAPTPEAKQGIANALRNAGVSQIGSPGDDVAMDGGLHRCEGPAFPGDRVEVMEPGWLVHDGVGEYLLEKALVRLI